ncbi:Coenzyme F420 hydrogenase/dehydrogenase, beta subunit C-terminal domain [Phenylobacterium koreense]|uniref:Coenzyme F420 hydrogenase subunit beta n=1 Tax=Phenylobacterium koreense TaxID=266125 RepID=A0ABV2EM48_9CAUL
MERSLTVDRVLRGELCTGCGLCASVAGPAIGMEVVPPGYNRPRQAAPISDEAEQVIAQTCPGAVVTPWSKDEQIDPCWGPWRQVLTGHATDETVRYEGSSGGVLTALLIHALATGLVDRVIHVRADPHSPTRNIITCSRTAEEVLTGAGSRYTGSSPLAGIDQALSQGGAIAFVGKPCDVSALRSFATLDPRVDQHVRLMLSFFCGGMPSHDGVLRILAKLGVEPQEVAAFRYRGQGWPGTAAATTHDGRVEKMSYAASWGDHLSKEVQFRCKICPDAVGGAADIACADAWYGDERGYPSFAEQDGRSLILARTEVGERLLADASGAAVISTQAIDIGEIGLMQPAQANRKRLVRARVAALSTMFQPRPQMRGTLVERASKEASARDKLRNFLGALRRIATNNK